MNTKLRKNANNGFEKKFFKLMNNSVFGKPMENVRNHRDIKLVTSDKRRKRLVSEPQIFQKLYLGMSILYISKKLMYEFWYNYSRPKYGERAKICYTDTDSFIIYIITKNCFDDISNDVEKCFDTSNCDLNDKRPLPLGKNKKVSGLFNDELGVKIITEFFALRPKAYSYLYDDCNERKKSKGTKRCVIKQNLMFQNFKDGLFNGKTIYRLQQRFKSYNHDVYTEQVNKTALSSNDDK